MTIWKFDIRGLWPFNDAEQRARKHWERAEKAEGALKVAAMHNNELQEENDQLKAQVAELREALQDIYPHLESVNHYHLPGGKVLYASRIWDLLASPNPGADLLAKMERLEKFVRSQPCTCHSGVAVTREMVLGVKCERCKALGL